MKISLVKMFRDIKNYKGRTMLTMVGLLIGMASIGAVLSAYSILNREINRSFLDTNPASIVLDVRNLDDKAIKLVQETYKTSAIEVRKTIQARVHKGDGTYGTIYLRAIPDFKHQAVDKIELEKGQFPSSIGEIVLERDSLKILENLTGGGSEKVWVKLPGGTDTEMKLSGLVHAPGLAPASMENYSYGFLGIESLNKLGYDGRFNEMRVVSYTNRFDHQKMTELAQELKKLLAQNGYKVDRVDVPLPGKHPHADQLSSILFLLQAFTLIALLSACLIIINLLNFILCQQAKQIAVMKAVGATTRDIVLPYFIYVLIISICGLILSIPLAVTAGRGYADFAAGILNFDITSYQVPLWVFILQILAGVLIPLVSAAYPIYRNCSKSVKDSLSDNRKAISSLNSTSIMPINNLLRKRKRTILAVLALTAGGTIFMISQNMLASIDKTIISSFNAFSWDYEIRLAQNYPENQLKQALKAIDGVEKTEIWYGNTVLFKKSNGTDSANYLIKVRPSNSQMVNLPTFSGRDIKNYNNAIMVNKVLADEEKWITPGMMTPIEINGKIVQVSIAGIANEAPALPTVYIGLDTYKKLFGGNSRQIILATANTRDIQKQRLISKNIEEGFTSARIGIAENLSSYVLRKAIADHLHIIITLLAAIAMLAVLVGGLSIGSAIGLSITERKREIGVLRAVGAARYQIISLFLFEVVIMGILGWAASILLAYPLSILIGNYFGQIFLHSDLQNTVSISGSSLWLVISIVVSLMAGSLPAWRVANAPLREMLEVE